MTMTLTPEAYNEICDIVITLCKVDGSVADEVASSVMGIITTGGLMDIETACKKYL